MKAKGALKEQVDLIERDMRRYPGHWLTKKLRQAQYPVGGVMSEKKYYIIGPMNEDMRHENWMFIYFGIGIGFGILIGILLTLELTGII